MYIRHLLDFISTPALRPLFLLRTLLTGSPADPIRLSFLKGGFLSGVFISLILVGCTPPSSTSTTSSTSTKSTKSIPTTASIPPDTSPVIATVGEVKITQNDLKRHMSQLSAFSRSRYQGPERKQELIDSLIRFELLAQHALSLGYDQDPDVELTYKQALIKVLIQKEMRGRVKMSELTQEELKAYYQNHLSDYQKPERRRAGVIVLKTQAEAEAVLKQIQVRLKAYPQQQRKIFGEFTYQKSIDQASKLRRGDLGYLAQTPEGDPVSKESKSISSSPLDSSTSTSMKQEDSTSSKNTHSALPQAVRDALFSLEKRHQIYNQVIPTSKGTYLVQLLGRQKAVNRSFKDVETEIRNLLFRKKKSDSMENYVKDLKKQAKVEINQEILKHVSLPKNLVRQRPNHPLLGPTP